MVAKITQAKAVGGMLQYNNKKLEKGEASILGYNKIITGGKDIEKLGIAQTQKSFDSFGNLNKELKRKYIHVSLNPHPDEKLSDEKLTDIAKDYMKQLGYASQPYIIYKHTDIERTHLHIVSCNVKANGKTITDSNLFRRSNEIRKGIEKKYDLKEGAVKKNPIDYANTKKVDYKKGDNNAQIKTKALTILSLVKFSSFDSYKRHMANYNIAVDIRKEANHPDGKILGSTYQVTNDKGVGEGLAIKASHIDRGGNLDLKKLEKKFDNNKEDKQKRKDFFEKNLQSVLKNSNNAGFEKGAEIQGISIIKNKDNIDSYLDIKSGHLYEKSELSKQTQNVIEQGTLNSVDYESQIEKEPSAAEHVENIASSIIDILGSGANTQGGGGSTDKDMKRKKRRKRGI